MKHILGLRRAALAAALAGGCAAAVAAACGAGDIGDLTAGSRDAGVDSNAAEPDSAVCVHATVAERPTTGDEPNGPPLVFVFDSVRIDTGERDGGPPKPRGLDLDLTCTCLDPLLEPESCVPPDAGGAKRPCDDADGRDNAAGPLLAAAASAAQGLGPAALEGQLRSGVYNIVLSLRGWNGQPNDPAVIFGVQVSPGVEGSQRDGGRERPKFDGTDVWTVTPASVLGGGDLVGTDCRTVIASCIPTKSDTNAYVRDGVVVAHLDLVLPIATTTGPFALEFVAATITAKISKTGDHHRVVGEIAGRWPAERLLPSLARIPNPLNAGHPLCASDAGLQIYGVAKRAACGALDLMASPALDKTGAGCDALSNAISFTGVSATLGTVYDQAPLVDECAGFTDRCHE